MKGKRSGVEFEDHLLIVTDLGDEGVIHTFKKLLTRQGMIKFINVEGILAVTGDYGNWMFCRPFIPSKESNYVSSGYWNEKLEILSTQNPYEFDEEATEKEIQKYLDEDKKAEEDADEKLTEEERDYLENCLDAVDQGEHYYTAFAHMNNVGRFGDHECVPLRKKLNPWLEVIYDAYDEIVRRYKENETM